MKATGTAIEPIWEEKRENPRFPFSSTVMFEDYRAGTCHDGRMVDHSRTGMRFETGIAPELGAEIFIGMDRSPYSTAHDVFRARVVWLQAQPCSYSVGVKYY